MAGYDDADDMDESENPLGRPPERLAPLAAGVDAAAVLVGEIVRDIYTYSDPTLNDTLESDGVVDAIERRVAEFFASARTALPDLGLRLEIGLLATDGTLAVPASLLPPSGTLDLGAASPAEEEQILPVVAALVLAVDDVARVRNVAPELRALLGQAAAVAVASAVDQPNVEVAGYEGTCKVALLLESEDDGWLVPNADLSLMDYAHALGEDVVAERLAGEEA